MADRSSRLAWCCVVLLAACNGGGGGREAKQEFMDQVATLGPDRIGAIIVPDSASVNLADHQGSYGYTIAIEAGATIEVCVTAAGGSASVTYFPEYSPGFDFLDAAPGCTDLTNKDPANENTALTVISGTGSISVTTRFL